MATRKTAGTGGKSPGPARKKAPRKTAARKTTGRKTAPRKPAASKTAARKRPAAKKKQGPKVTTELKKAGISLLILVAVCLTGAMVADIFITRDKRPEPRITQKPPPVKTAKPKEPGKSKPNTKSINGNGQFAPLFEDISDVGNKKPQAGLKLKNGHPVIYELFDETMEPRVKKTPPPKKQADEMPRIALIIDDIGYDKKIAMALYDLDPDITFAVLPWSPFGEAISRNLNARGAHLMLHLPMEPVQYPEVNPGKGALLSSMAPDVLLDTLRADLRRVPGVRGVNNHMGSRLTTLSSQMNQIFTILKKRDLFFIDSVTAPKSQCRASARLLQLRFAERDIFLDNFQNIEYITGQFNRLKKIARKHGSAIGIGHPYQATLETLEIELPKIRGKIRIIRAGEMVAVPD